MGRKNRIILAEIEDWYKQNLINDSMYNRLSSMYQQDKWDFSTIIRWALVVGAVMIGIGLISFITLLFQSVVFAILVISTLSLAAYYYGFNLSSRDFKYYLPKTGNSLIAIASLLLAGDIFLINNLILDNNIGWVTLVFVISIIYVFIAYLKDNTLLLVLGLLGFATWFGAETGYVSGWGAYYLGLNYPLRFALVSPIVILIGYYHKKCDLAIPRSFIKTYYSFGLLFLNLSLWILSIFGRQSGMNYWFNNSNNIELLLFSILWAVVDIIVFVIGTKYQNKIFVGYAITFIILNLYTRYFEYFWDEMHKSFFFIILGGISVGVGLYFEKRLNGRKEY